MADDITICNMALAKVGAERITSLHEDSRQARLCAMFFEQTRDEVLQAAPWDFAVAREKLTRLSARPLFGWRFAYQLPTDYLAVLQLNAWFVNEPRPVWEVEGLTLLTDAAEAQLRYVRRVTNSVVFPPLFAEALYTKLAAKLAEPLSGSQQRAEALLREFEAVVSRRAGKANAREGRPRRKQPWVESDFVRARFTGQ